MAATLQPTMILPPLSFIAVFMVCVPIFLSLFPEYIFSTSEHLFLRMYIPGDRIKARNIWASWKDRLN